MIINTAFLGRSLQLSDGYLSAALDQAALGFREVDLSAGNAMSCTDQCKRNFGRDPLLAFSYQDMLATIVPEDQQPMQAAVGRAIAEQCPYFAQYRVKLEDGTIRWIEAQGMVIYKDGYPEKIIGTTIDITKVKNLEILRDELLSFAMHEIKTPLSTVKGSLQILEKHLKKGNDEQISAIATRALSSTERLTRLLNEMARPVLAQLHEIILQKANFDLLGLINEIAANAILLHPDVQIIITSADQELFIFADRFRVSQVITNLVNNAIKYSPEVPKIMLEVTGTQSWITVKVSDQGLGIAPEDRAKVFQKFYRSGERRAIDGLGIGLFLSSEIIIRHGGEIGIEDKDAPGTTVYFRLPVVLDAPTLPS